MWRTGIRFGIVVAFVLAGAARERAAEPADRLDYLEERSPFHVDEDFPRLTTPMWFGEEGVEAAVILSIDDLNTSRIDHYRKYLEPILDRLEALDGSSPLSIFTNTVDPRHPQLARWLSRGVRLDVHTRSHPCPLLGEGFDGAVAEVFDCLANLAQVAGPAPVAYRMPCCDSINSASPRFFSEIFRRRAADGSFLKIDSSVLMFPEASYRDYAPFQNYAATAQGYPYPYVIGADIWEFPIIAPTDWQAQHRRSPFHAETVADMKRAIDIVVDARGLYTLCFHPHGWIRSAQVVELIDHVERRHGKSVRFVQYHEALERIERNLLGGRSLRDAEGRENGIRLLDLDADGFLDVVVGNDASRRTRLWKPAQRQWVELEFPYRLVSLRDHGSVVRRGVHFGIFDREGAVSAVRIAGEDSTWHRFDGESWRRLDATALRGLRAASRPVESRRDGVDRGVRLRDVDSDGLSDIIVNNETQNAVFLWRPGPGRFEKANFGLPRRSSIVDAQGKDRGLRLVDLDDDGDRDVVLSNDDEFYVYLFENVETGWSQRVLHGAAGATGALPKIVSDGADRGAWFRDGVLHVANEDTVASDDLVEIRRFENILETSTSQPREPREAAESPSSSGAPLGSPWQRFTIDDASRGADGVRLADVNGDGRQDIVTGWEEGGVVRVCLQPERSRIGEPWPSWRVGPARSVEDAVFVDLDGDGATDVVSSCEGRVRSMFVHWAPSESSRYGHPDAWVTRPIEASRDVMAWMYCVPLQIDGRHGIDLLAGGKGSGGGVGWFEAPADPRDLGAWKWRRICDAGWIMSLVAEDMDGDGDADVVVSDRKGPARGCYWLENPGAGKAAGGVWNRHDIGGANSEVMFLTVADLDGDGLRDIVLATRTKKLLIFRRLDGSGRRWEISSATIPERTGMGKAVAVGDIDLDGRADLVASCGLADGEKSGLMYLERQDGDGPAGWLAREIGGPEGTKYDLVELLDLDADGDLDVITCEERRNLGVVWYRNPTR